MPSDDDSTGPALPAGVLRSRGGWADSYNLEMMHQQERLRDEHAAPQGPSHAAVDLSQFRNEEVGKGYQAKHVVRQREATSSTTTGVVDMSGGKFSKKDGGESPSKKRRRGDAKTDGDAKTKDKKKQHMDERLDSYLKCKGMREFMKDIDKILKQ